MTAKLTVETKDGRQIIEAEPVGMLFVHRCLNGPDFGWDITEPVTGLSVAHGFDSQELAVSAASEMDALVDWRSVIESVAEGETPPVMGSVLAIVSRHGGYVTCDDDEVVQKIREQAAAEWRRPS